MTDEEVTQMAPGLIKAFAPQEEEMTVDDVAAHQLMNRYLH